MMANADKVAAEANAAAIAEDVGIVQGASADALGIGAGAAETLADVTNDLCDMGALTGTRTSRSGKIKVHVASKSTVALYVVLGVLAAITVFALVVMDYGKVSFPAAMAAAVEDFVTMMTQPGLGGHFTLPDVIEGLFVSLALALLTTFIGAVIAFVLGLLAACNLSSKGMSNAIKVFMSVARAVPTILWVLVFSVAIGLGPEAAVTGLLFHSVAYLVKAYSESFEEVDAGVLEALRASGASWWQVVFQGVVPEKVNEMLSWTFIRFEINFVNAVAVGADPDRMAGVDNFCWCDPVQSEKTPDGEYKLAQLVRACKALSALCVAYGVPCISGKDSMKNDYTGGGKKISIPPTVLFSVLGIMDDVKKAVTSDFKKPGDRLYIIGNTARELAGSEIADQLGIACNTVPRVDAKSALASYRKLHQAINSRLISACHDLSDGGLAVSLAEMCIGGRLGAHLALNRVPVIGALTLTEALYSESASRLLVSVAPDKAAEFEALFGASAPFIGEVTSDARLTVASADSALFSAPVEALAHAFKATLDW